MSYCEKNGSWNSAAGSRRMHVDPTGPRLHRIAEVMEEECLSARAAALRMNVTASQAQSEAQPTSDLLLSTLYRWQAALNVPLVDMLREPGSQLSPPVQDRGRLLKAMRTVRSIQETTDSEAIRNLGMQLAQQLIELMPELRHVSAWPVFGQRRRSEDYGAIFDRQIPDEFFRDAGANE